MSNTTKLRVFISYAPEDEKFKTALEKHLTMLRRSDKIATWNSSAILAGCPLDDSIKYNIQYADIIILLVSIDFMASDKIWHDELTFAMERHQRQEARVVPIYISECDKEGAPFEKIKGLPAKGVVGSPSNDTVWTEVTRGIRDLVEYLAAQPSKKVAPPPPMDYGAPKQKPRTLTAQLTDLVGQGKLERAMELLPNNSNDWVLLKARFNRNKSDFAKGILEQSKYALENNKISHALLELLKTEPILEADSEMASIKNSVLPAQMGDVPDDINTNNFGVEPKIVQSKIVAEIPEQMKMNEATRCSVRIAVEEGKLKKNVPSKFQIEDIEIISKQVMLKVDYNKNDFIVDFITDEVLNINFTGVTEWAFRVTPLREGNFPLDIVLYALLDNAEKTTVNSFAKTIMVKSDVPTKQKILFLAANPSNEARLQTDKEHRIIKDQMRGGKHRDRYEFLPPQFALTMQELIRAMNDKPNIVHFSGHGLTEGIAITNANNEMQLLQNQALKLLFKPHKDNVSLVLLNSCYSVAQAKIISQIGCYVIGNNKPVGDEAAISFAAGLYNGLGEGKSIEEAYNDGLLMLIAENPDYFDVIEIWQNGEKLAI
jgi:hypothetical protein